MPLTPDLVFRNKSAVSITRHASLSEFVRDRDTHVEVSPAAKLTIDLPNVLNMPVENVRIQRPADMPLPGSGFVTSVPAPRMTVARLSGVTCLPSGIILAQPGIVVEETFSAPWERKYHHNLAPASASTYVLKRSYADPSALPGKYICLDYQHYQHFGHFIVDVLSRAWGFDYLESVLGIPDIRVLVPGDSLPFADHLLDLLGIPPDRLVRLTGPVAVDELFVPSKSFQIQEYTSALATGTWRRISGAARGAGGPRRLYISRSRNGQRSLLNEAEIERMVADRGFIVVHPQTLSAAEQVGLFANAELVIGASGSNVFSLAFQRRLRAALILVSPALVHHTDVFLRYGNKSDLSYFVGDRAVHHPAFDPMNVHSGWTVDRSAFESCLDRWLSLHN